MMVSFILPPIFVPSASASSDTTGSDDSGTAFQHSFNVNFPLTF